MNRRWLPLAVAVLSISRGALADSDSSGRADRAFREARALMDRGFYEDACKLLAESQDLEPKLGTLTNLAYCHQRLGRTGTAWREYSQALAQARASGDALRENFATDRLAELTPGLARLLIHAEQPVEGFRAVLDGAELGPEVLDAAFPIDPGEHSLVASAPGKVSWRKQVAVASQASLVLVTVPSLVDEPAPAPAALVDAARTPGSDESTPAARTDRLRQGLGWSALAVGAAGVAVGSYYGIEAFVQKGDAERLCHGNACPKAGLDLYGAMSTSETVSTVAFSVGAASAGVGLYLLLFRRVPRASSDHWVAPVVGANSVGAVLGTVF
jgi:hypothetical protein